MPILQQEGLVVGSHFVGAVVAKVGIELAQVFVAECVYLQFHQHVTLEHAVVEHEVHEEGIFPYEDTLLPRLEAEAVPEFQKERFELR